MGMHTHGWFAMNFGCMQWISALKKNGLKNINPISRLTCSLIQKEQIWFVWSGACCVNFKLVFAWDLLALSSGKEKWHHTVRLYPVIRQDLHKGLGGRRKLRRGTKKILHYFETEVRWLLFFHESSGITILHKVLHSTLVFSLPLLPLPYKIYIYSS